MEPPGRVLESCGRALELPGSELESHGSALESPGGGLESSGRALEALGRVPESFGRALKLPGGGPESCGRVLELRGRALEPPGGAQIVFKNRLTHRGLWISFPPRLVRLDDEEAFFHQHPTSPIRTKTMKDEFANRLTAFQTTRDTLFLPRWKAVWENQPPVIFTTRAAEASQALADLEDFCRRHGVLITGAAAEKDREELELEDAAFLQAKTLVEFYRAAGNETEASKYDLAISRWRQLRDVDLLARAKSVILAMEALTVGPDATEAAKYDIIPAATAALQKEWDDYNALVTAPAQAISTRKALTSALRTEFAKVSAKFESLDNLVGKFGTTSEGREFVATYKASRIIRDAGRRPAPVTPAPEGTQT